MNNFTNNVMGSHLVVVVETPKIKYLYMRLQKTFSIKALFKFILWSSLEGDERHYHGCLIYAFQLNGQIFSGWDERFLLQILSDFMC